MYENAGIFLNNTFNNIKSDINLSNIKLLSENFDKIFVIDNNQNFNDDMKSKFKNNNNILFVNVNFDDYIEKIIYFYEKFNNFKTLTFIIDEFIILNNLNEYFNFVKNTSYDYYSYTDSSENFYHMQTNIFTLKNIVFPSFFELCTNLLKSKNLLNKKEYNHRFYKEFVNLKFKRSVFLKIAYMDSNYGKNIFNEFSNYYEELLKNDLLPLVSYNLLKNFDNKFDNQNFVFKKIPDDFEVEIYKSYEDLQGYDDGFLKNHFLEHGQFECRKYSLNNHILPISIYNKLKKIKLLKYFDFPEKFDFNIYKYKNDDLNTLNKLQLKKHWFEYGIYEKRVTFI